MRQLIAFVAGFGLVITGGMAVAAMNGHTDQPPAVERVAAWDIPTTTLEKVDEPSAKDEVDEPTKTETTETPETESPKTETPEVDEPTTTEAPDVVAPEIVILSPENGSTSHEKTIVFKGETEPGAKVYAGEYEADVTEDGHWAIKLVLNQGSNVATFTAVDAAGNEGHATVKVFYEPPVKTIEFSAHQKYRQNADGVEKFYGTGTPGSRILAKSEYGAADTEVGASGEWVVKVVFDAPAGKTFAVVVSDDLGHSQTFEFTRTEPKVIDFWAAQKYGSCSETPPYDVFYGEGAPGTVVEVGSAYGTGRIVIGETGKWDMKVIFEGAPVGETFPVILETSTGARQEFHFTRTAG